MITFKIFTLYQDFAPWEVVQHIVFCLGKLVFFHSFLVVRKNGKFKIEQDTLVETGENILAFVINFLKMKAELSN